MVHCRGCDSWYRVCSDCHGSNGAVFKGNYNQLYHNRSVSEYRLNCGKNEGAKSHSRTVTNYRCNTCGKSYQYKNAASSGCNICGGTHNVGADGSQTGSHNAVASYLVCGY